MRRLAIRLSLLAAFGASLSACVVAPVPVGVAYYQPAPRYYYGGPTYYQHDNHWSRYGYRHKR